MSDVILEYETGHPTRLKKAIRLATMIAELGKPTRMDGWHLFWEDKIGTVVPETRILAEYYVKFRWPGDTRMLTGVRLSN